MKSLEKWKERRTETLFGANKIFISNFEKNLSEGF